MRNNSNESNESWDLVIGSNFKKNSLNIKELISYRDLLFLFVKRDFISLYKQTILGPLWVVIQPILTTITFYVIFTRIAAVGTDGIPPILFYMIGVTVWTYFADCVTKTSETFIANQNIFGKVYFPRLIVPLSLVITNLIKFGIQFVLFLCVYMFYAIDAGESASWGLSWQLSLIPLLIFVMAALGLGTGLIISALTTKYKDLKFLIEFGIRLAMYATPVVWPLSKMDDEHQWKLMINPMTSIVETFKVCFFGSDNGVFSWYGLGYSTLFAIIVLWIGMRLFTRIEKSFMDTI